jgi:tetratricopeptide (TPR) repeat protein
MRIPTRRYRRTRIARLSDQSGQGEDKKGKTLRDQLLAQVSLINVVIVVVLVLAMVVLYGEITRDTVVIEPFNVPADLEKMGYSGHVIATKLAEKIELVVKESETSRKGRSFTLANVENLPDIEVPETKISLQALARYLRQFLRRTPPQVEGDITLTTTNNGVRLSVEVTSNGNQETKSFDGSRDNIDALLLECAKYVLRQTEPLALAEYLYGKGEKDDCLGLIQYCIYREPHTIQRKYNEDAPWAHILLGYLQYDKRDFWGAISEYKTAIDLDGKFADGYVSWGVALEQLGDYDGARAKYRKAIELNPKLSDAHLDLGYLLLNNAHEYDNAFTSFENAILADPGSSYAYVGRSYLLRARAEYGKAIADDRTALEIKPQLAEAHIAWGQALQSQMDYDAAILEYQKAIEIANKSYDINKNEATAYQYWGDVLWFSKDYPGAIEKLNKASQLDSFSPSILTDWGNVLRDKLDYQGAIAKYQQAIALSPRFVYAYVSWGYALAYNDDFQGASAEAEQAIKYDSNFTDSYRLRAYIQKSKNNDPKGALETLENASKRDLLSDGVYLDAGAICYEQEDYDRAIEYGKKALSVNPYSSDAYVLWGNALKKQNEVTKQNEQGAGEKYQKALAVDRYSNYALWMWADDLRDKGDTREATDKYQKALKLYPFSAQAYTDWGVMLLKDRSTYNAAIVKLKAAVRLDPGSSTAFYYLGCVFFEQHKYKLAITQFEKAIEISADYKDAYFYLGDALKEIGNYPAAIANYKKVVELAGGSTDGAKASDAISELEQRMAKGKAR